jgi:hypothetical protein
MSKAGNKHGKELAKQGTIIEWNEQSREQSSKEMSIAGTIIKGNKHSRDFHRRE